jgi:hypothetical protein
LDTLTGTGCGINAVVDLAAKWTETLGETAKQTAYDWEEALPPDASSILNKYADEAVAAVTRTLNEIRGYYIPKTEAPAQD